MERLAVAAEVLLIIVGAVGFYEARSFGLVQKVLSRLGFLKRFIFRSRTVTIFEKQSTGERVTRSATATGLFAFTPPPRPAGTVVGIDEDGDQLVIVEEYNEDLASSFYFTVATLATAFFISMGDSLVSWLVLPFLQIARAAAVWSDLSLSWSLLIVPLMSLGHLLLGLVAFALIYTLGMAAMIKSAFIISDAIATRITPAAFKRVLFVMFIGASLVALLAPPS